MECASERSTSRRRPRYISETKSVGKKTLSAFSKARSLVFIPHYRLVLDVTPPSSSPSEGPSMAKQIRLGSDRDRNPFPSPEAQVRDQHVSYTAVHHSCFPFSSRIYSYTSFFHLRRLI